MKSPSFATVWISTYGKSLRRQRRNPTGSCLFNPGPGLGGHCIPVDPFYLSWKAKEYGFYTRFIDLAGEINNMMPHFVVTKVDFALNKEKKSLNGSHILALGVAYKADIADTRESPAIDVIRILLKKHAKVTVFDPHVSRVSIDGTEYPCIDQPDAKILKKADAVLILTDHAAFDYKLIAENADIIVDTRNALKGIRKRKVFKL